MIAPFVGEQLRDFGAISSPGRAPGAFCSRLPSGFSGGIATEGILEQVFSGLDSVLAPPALRVRATGPQEMLSGEVVGLLALATRGSGFCFRSVGACGYLFWRAFC